MVLGEPTVADIAHHPAPLPRQQHRPPRDLQIPDLAVAAVMTAPAGRPAIGAARTRHRRRHPHRQPLRRVNDDLQNSDARQPQPHRHNITRHRGPPGFGVQQHRSQQGLDPYKRTLNPPSSHKNAKDQTRSVATCAKFADLRKRVFEQIRARPRACTRCSRISASHVETSRACPVRPPGRRTWRTVPLDECSYKAELCCLFGAECVRRLSGLVHVSASRSSSGC